MDVHREGSRRTVWHHITIEGQKNNAEGGVNEVWNFRGTPLDYHEVYATHFDYDEPDPPEEPETSNDGNGSEITQTNQGLEDRYTWAENHGGELELDEYKPKDKPYETADTEGVKGMDHVRFLRRDNVYGGDAPPHVGAGEPGDRMWWRVMVRGDGNYRIEADSVALGDRADPDGGGDALADGVAAGYVSGGVDVYYVQGGVKMSADADLSVKIGEENFTSDEIPEASQEPVSDRGDAPPEVAPPDESDDESDSDNADDNGDNMSDPITIMNDNYDALAELSDQKILDVSDGDDITDELESAAEENDTLTVVPAGEYSTDYLDLDMNSCAIIGEPGERVVLEPNDSRDDAGEYFITIEGDTWSFSNFVFDFTEDGYGGRLQADGETFVVSDIRTEGKYPPESKGFSTDVNAGETGLIARCEVSGTEQDGTDTNGILVSSSHEGTIYLRDNRMGGFTNNAVYGSDPGRDYGNDGRVVVEGGKFYNSNVANLRIGSTDSVAREATIVVDKRVKTSEGNQSGENSRGIRVRDRHGCLVEDCDVTYKEGGSGGNAAIAIHDEAGRAIVRNCRVKTAGQLPHLRVEESGMSGDVGVLVEGCHFTGDGSNPFDLERDDLTIRNCLADFETDVDGIEYAPDRVQEPSTEARTPVDRGTGDGGAEAPDDGESDESDGETPWGGGSEPEAPEQPEEPEQPEREETRIYVEGDGSVDQNVSYTIEVTGDARLGGLSGESDNIVFSDGNTTIVGEVPADSDDDFFVTGEIVSVQKHPALTVEIDGEPYTDTSRVYVFGNEWVSESDRGEPSTWKAYRVDTSAGAEKDRKADSDDEIVTADGSASIRGVVPLNADDAFLIDGAVENIVAPPEVNFWIDGNDYVGSRELRSPEGIVTPDQPNEEPPAGGETPPEETEPEPPEETPDESPDKPEEPEQPEPPEEPEQPEGGDETGDSEEPETPQPPSGEVPDVPEDAPDVPEIPDGVPTGDPSTLTRAELTAGFVAMLNSLDYFNQE